MNAKETSKKKVKVYFPLSFLDRSHRRGFSLRTGAARSSRHLFAPFKLRHEMRAQAAPICGGSAPPLIRRAATARASPLKLMVPATTSALSLERPRPRPRPRPLLATARPLQRRRECQRAFIPRANSTSSSSSDDVDAPLLKEKARTFVPATVRFSSSFFLLLCRPL